MSLDVEPPEAGEPHKTGHSVVDMAVAICALFVSIVSLVLAMVHGRTMERMAEANARLVEANSWPFLQTSTGNQDNSGAPVITLDVANAGVGPAKIHSVEVFYRGVRMGSWVQLLTECCAARGHVLSYASSTTANFGVLRAGQEVAMLSFPDTPQNHEVWTALNVQRSAVSYRVCYCSVFDDCWITDGATLEPQRTPRCAKPAQPFDPLLQPRR